MPTQNRPNILEGLQIGSTLFSATQRIAATVIKPGITDVNPKIQKTQDLVTSNSHYVHNAQSTETSLGISGSGGVSGLFQVEAGLAASWSDETSNASQALSITMSRFVTAGIEYIDFDSLRPEEFIAALKGAPDADAPADDLGTGIHRRMVRVLNAYNALLSSDIAEHPQALVDSEALDEWVNAKHAFFDAAGDMLVVGIVWGGWGGVSLSFDKVTTESLWEMGTTGKFSIAGTGASVAVEASYGEVSLGEDQLSSGRVERISHGNAIDDFVTAWENKLSTILTDKVTEIGSTTVGDLGGASIPSLPDAPDRVKPKSSKGIADKIASVKDLSGLEVLAKAQAFDNHVKQARKNGETPMSLDEFLDHARQPNDVSGLNDDIFPVDFSSDEDLLQRRVASNAAPMPKAKLHSAAESDPFRDFVAVGAWLVPWGQIFPWLAEPQHNEIPSGTFSSDIARLRMLISDLATLARIYRHLEVMGVKSKKLNLDPGSIATAFQSIYGKAQTLLRDHLKEPGGRFDQKTLRRKMKETLSALTSDYRPIYKTWIKTPLLRQCELGAGLTGHWTGWTDEKTGKDAVYYECPVGLVDGTILSTGSLWNFASKTATFDQSLGNYYAFAEGVKVTPTILPSGEIVAFVAWTDSSHGMPGAGLLCAYREATLGCFISQIPEEGTEKEPGTSATLDGHVITFSAAGASLLGRTYAPIQRGASTADLRLHPIPFTAAENVNWTGGQSAFGISDINGQIRAMQDRLAALSRWSFGNEFWSERDPHDPMLSLQKLKPVYVGLTEEPAQFKNVIS